MKIMFRKFFKDGFVKKQLRVQMVFFGNVLKTSKNFIDEIQDKARVVENYSLADSAILTHTPLVLDFAIQEHL